MDPDMLTWFEPPQPVDEAEVAAVERALGVVFPADYRSFLRRFQGGYPEQTDFPLNDPRKSIAAVGVFLSVRPERDTDYLLTARDMLQDRLPARVIPIAMGPEGDYVCLDYRAAAPAVVYWHHERSGSDELTPIANSFGEFISLLYEPDIEAESALDRA